MHRILVAGNDILCSVEERIPLAAKGFKIVLTNNLRKSVGMILENPPDLLIIRKGFENDGDLKLIRTVKGEHPKGKYSGYSDGLQGGGHSGAGLAALSGG